MKSNRKKISLGVFGLVSLLSALFITVAPGTGVSAQDPSPAKDARLLLSISQGGSGANNPVISVSFSSANCDSPVGGTLHQPSGRGSFVALGVTNAAAVPIVTHVNTNANSMSGANSDPCDYTVTLVSNLNCVLSATGQQATGAPTANLIGGTTKLSGNAITGTSTGRFTINGADESANATFFTSASDPAADGAILMLSDPTPANGSVTAVDPTTGATSAIALGDSLTTVSPMLAGIVAITVTASSCDNPRDRAFRGSNAEPSDSLASKVLVAPRGGCNSGSETETSLSAGSQAILTTIRSTDDCTYDLSVALDLAASDVVLSKNGLKTQCGLQGIVYRLSGSTLETTIIAPEDKAALNRLSYVGSELRLTRGGTLLDGEVVQITTYITTDCPTVGQAAFTFSTTAETNAAVAKSTITVTIAPAPGSDSGCVATPGSVEIKGSGKTARSALIERPRGGSTCSYVVTYPKAESALSLVHEHGGSPAVAAVADDPTTSNVDEAAAAIPAVTHADNEFDGIITLNARRLTGTNVTSAQYTTRNLPITVTMNFDADAEFLTSERVAYRIAVVGTCARFPTIIARALGDTGTYRSVLPFGGTTVIFDKSLESSESPLNQAGNLLYEIAPVVIVKDTPQPCTVEVEEVASPVGCTVEGGVLKTVTFATGSAGFNFDFNHVCEGRTRSEITRGLTG